MGIALPWAANEELPNLMKEVIGMAIVRWNPYRSLGNLQREVDELFETFGFPAWSKQIEAAGGDWLPAVDIRETKDAFEVEAELPGLSKEEIKVEMQDDVISLRGERKTEKNVREGKYHYQERTFGSFTRSFRLPGPADASKVQAEYKDGVLILTVPKTEGSKNRQIQIN